MGLFPHQAVAHLQQLDDASGGGFRTQAHVSLQAPGFIGRQGQGTDDEGNDQGGETEEGETGL